MKIMTLPVDRFTRVNDIPEVVSPIFLEKDRPDPNGPFSLEIFGTPGSKKRQNQFGKIFLGTTIMHPFIYRQLSLMDARIAKIIAGMLHVRLGSNGELIEDSKGQTGIGFLIDNLKKIKFAKTGSSSRDYKIDMLDKLPQENLFISEWVLRPAWYRDLDFAAERITNVVEINEVYQRMIGTSRMIQSADKGSLQFNSAVVKQHEYTYEAHKMLYEEQIPKKKGRIKQTIIGKAPDYRAITVLAIPKISEAETPEDIEVGFSEIGFPLHIACSLFWPFTIRAINELLSDKVAGLKQINVGGALVSAEVISDQLTEKAISRMFRLFKISIESRFQVLTVEDEKGKELPLNLYNDVLKREFTLADLFFLAGMKAVEGKVVTSIRYPVTSHQSTVYLTPKIITTERTVFKDFGPIIGSFKNYPDVDCEFWREATALDIGTFDILGADTDGDTVGSYGPFTIEGIEESKNIMNSKAALIRPNGQSARSYKNEHILSAYSMTY